MRIENNLDPNVLHIINRCPSGTSCLWLATLENFWCQKWQQSYRTFITLSFHSLKSMDARKNKTKNLVKSSCGHRKENKPRSLIHHYDSGGGAWPWRTWAQSILMASNLITNPGNFANTDLVHEAKERPYPWTNKQNWKKTKQQQIVIKSQIVLSSSAAGNWKKKTLFFFSFRILSVVSYFTPILAQIC